MKELKNCVVQSTKNRTITASNESEIIDLNHEKNREKLDFLCGFYRHSRKAINAYGNPNGKSHLSGPGRWKNTKDNGNIAENMNRRMQKPMQLLNNVTVIMVWRSSICS